MDKQKLRVYISIVISAVLVGLTVSYCIKAWMPADAMGWIAWGAMAVAGVIAVLRIAMLAKMLSNKEE